MDPRETLTEAVAKSAPRLHELEKMRLERVVYRIVQQVQRDRVKIVERFMAEQEVSIRAAKTGASSPHTFLPLLNEVLCKYLWDSWTDQEKADVVPYEGFIFVRRSQWFVVEGEPEKVEEPVWRYIIDISPSGVLLFTDACETRPTTIMVVGPLSEWQRNYSGFPEYLVRRREAEDEAARAQREVQESQR